MTENTEMLILNTLQRIENILNQIDTKLSFLTVSQPYEADPYRIDPFMKKVVPHSPSNTPNQPFPPVTIC